MKFFLLKIIRLYQKTLSPDHGLVFIDANMRCRFYPSCSQYAFEAIERRGIVKGIIKGFWRVLRCNPLSKGGIDPV